MLKTYKLNYLEKNKGIELFNNLLKKGLLLEIKSNDGEILKYVENLYPYILNKNLSISQIWFLLIVSVIWISNNSDLISEINFYRIYPLKNQDFIKNLQNLISNLNKNIKYFYSKKFDIDNYNNEEFDFIQIWNIIKETEQVDYYISLFLNPFNKELKIYWNEYSKDYFKKELEIIKKIVLNANL